MDVGVETRRGGGTSPPPGAILLRDGAAPRVCSADTPGRHQHVMLSRQRT